MSLTVSCAGCRVNSPTVHMDSFALAIADLKKRGWHAQDGLYYCPTCSSATPTADGTR